MAIRNPVEEADRLRAAEPPEVALESLITSHLHHLPANIRCHPITGAIRRLLIRRHHLQIRHICILREDLS
jgi:hypothetical protein